MGPDRAGDQPEPADQQDQHDESVEQSRRLKVDVHVGDHSCQDKKCSARSKQPAENVSSIPKENADPEQHRKQRNSESVGTVETPIGTDYVHLVREKIASDTSHHEADQKLAKTARCPTSVAKRAVFHVWEDTKVRWRSCTTIPPAGWIMAMCSHDAGTRIRGEVDFMPKENASKPDSGVAQAAEHVAGAYKLLKALQEKIDEHPEIGQAVNKLETALAILEIQTGGML